MKHNQHCRLAALLAVLALTLSLLVGCGGGNNGDNAQQSNPPAVSDQQPDSQPDPQPAPGPDAKPEDDQPDGGDQPVQSQPNDGEPADSQPADQQPVEEPSESEPQTAQPQPVETKPEEPVQPPQEEQPAQSGVLADGSYTIAVTLEGGSGRASVESPAKLRCEGGQMWATIVWSSSNYDYMKVDGVQYDLISTEGNSTFEIPVAALDQALPVIADTVAMSTPHEVEYTLTFDSASLVQA